MTTENEMASQLRGIQRALIFCGACLCVSAVSDIYYSLEYKRENTERRYGRTFYEQADTLAREEAWDALLKLAQERQKKRPRDPNAFLFSGMAHLNKNEFESAVADFKRMPRINKSWQKSSETWLKEVERKRKEPQE